MRILHVLPRMPIGGVGTFLQNTQRNINNSFVFDYLIIEDVNDSYFSYNVEKLGAKVYWMNSKLKLSSSFNIYCKLKKFFKTNASNYDIIHLHSANIGFLVLPLAKKYGIKVRIIHAHATNYSDVFLRALRNYIIEIPIFNYSTNLIACSKKAGKFLFKNRQFDTVYNGIDPNKFKYVNNSHDKIILSNVGNFLPPKNHKFLIDMMEKLDINGDIYELWLIGDGELKENIENLVSQKRLKSVKFMGRIKDIEKYYQYIDIFLLPSFNEGFPVALMEAQCCGIPVVVSENITREIDFNNDCHFLGIGKEDIDKWIKVIKNINLNTKFEKSEKFKTSEFTIKNTTDKLEKLYFQYLKESVEK